MEAVRDDLAVALLTRPDITHPDITHLIGATCDGIDCRYDKADKVSRDECFPHLHLDLTVHTDTAGDLVMAGEFSVPAAIRSAGLEEDTEGCSRSTASRIRCSHAGTRTGLCSARSAASATAPVCATRDASPGVAEAEVGCGFAAGQRGHGADMPYASARPCGAASEGR
jgi:hypothetical protein